MHKTFLYFNKFNSGKNIVLRVHPLMSHFATCKDSNGNWKQYFEKSMSGPLWTLRELTNYLSELFPAPVYEEFYFYLAPVRWDLGERRNHRIVGGFTEEGGGEEGITNDDELNANWSEDNKLFLCGFKLRVQQWPHFESKIWTFFFLMET